VLPVTALRDPLLLPRIGNRSDGYEQYYIPNFINKDGLAIFLGTTRRDDFVRAVGRLERHTKALDDLNDAQKDEVSWGGVWYCCRSYRQVILRQKKRIYLIFLTGSHQRTSQKKRCERGVEMDLLEISTISWSTFNKAHNKQRPLKLS
jgi:hypothetical protein